MNSSWYPNTDLSAWTLALIAIVAVGALAVWLTAIYLAAREPRDEAAAAKSQSIRPTEAATSQETAEQPIAAKRAA